MRKWDTSSRKETLAQRGAYEHFLLDKPPTKRAGRARIGLNRTRRTWCPFRGWLLSKPLQPVPQSRFRELMDQDEVILRLEVLVQMSEDRLMPFEGLRAMSDRAMCLKILLDCSRYRQALVLLL